MMLTRRRAGTAASLAAALLMSAGFLGIGPAAGAASTGPSAITVSEGVQVEPNWWFPNMPGQYCSTENVQFFDLAYRPLLWVGNNDAVDWSQSIAQSVSVNGADDVYTIHLNHTFKWSNGQPVSAQDVAFDARLLVATTGKNPAWTDCGAGIGGYPSDFKSITTPNSSTVVVETTHPVNPAWFIQNGIGQIYPVPASVWNKYANWTTEEKWIEKVAVNPASPEFKVIDGPYAYGPFENNGYSTLIANPRYTGPDPAHIKTIRLLYETSSANLWAGALRGVFAMVPVPTEYNGSRMELTRARYQVGASPYGFCFDYSNPNLNPQDPQGSLLSLRYIRQALQLGLNQEGMIRLAGGVGSPEYGPVPMQPRTVNYDPQVAKYGYAYNPARGRRILEAHGWHMKNGVMTNAKGQTLTFKLLYATGSQWVTDSVELWQSNLKKEGIVLTLSSGEFNQVISTAFTTHNWEIAWWGGGWCYGINNYPTGDAFFLPGSAANIGDYNNPHMTSLIDATLAPATAAQTQARMDAYQIFAAEDLPFFYMPDIGGYQGIQPWLHVPAASWSAIRNMWLFNMWTDSAQ
jgi:peptide/nickel transport system substrate-binding protein